MLFFFLIAFSILFMYVGRTSHHRHYFLKSSEVRELSVFLFLVT